MNVSIVSKTSSTLRFDYNIFIWVWPAKNIKMGGCAPNNCNRPSNIDWDPTDEIGSQRSKQTTSTRKAKPMKAGEKSVNEDEEGNQDA